MKKQSAVGLFFSMFLRATVVILGIAIVIFGIVFLTKVMQKDDEGDKSVVTTVNENVLYDPGVRDDLLDNSTEEAENTDTEEPGEPVVSYDIMIAVLNSTDVGGLAGRWCDTLNEMGYESTYASDFSNTQDNTIIVAKNEGVGKELVELFDGATYQVGDIPEGSYEDLSEYDVVIVIGNADSDH